MVEPVPRLERLTRKLAAEVSAEAVICLQEVSLSWAGPLHAFFASRGYHFVFSSYGRKKNGYAKEAQHLSPYLSLPGTAFYFC